MKLQVPFVQLPLQFNAEALAREIDALGVEEWREHPQKFPGNFALPLISVDGDPDSDSVSGPMRPTAYLAKCPYLTQVLATLGPVWGRTRLMKLSGQAEVSPHFDINYYWRERMRVHVPIVTRPDVRFLCGDAEVNMKPGECWIFDTWRMHRVINSTDVERIHLVADTIGGEAFSGLVQRGRAPGYGAFEGWHAEPVEPIDGAIPKLRYESVNIPVVMSPWEMREHVHFLLSEVRPHPQLAAAQQGTARFLVLWQELWAEFGTDRAGWPAYRRALAAFEAFMQQVGASLTLANGGLLTNSLRIMILSVALNDSDRVPDGYEPRQPAKAEATSSAPAPVARDPEFDRPIFILSSPRSGSTLLFETLAQASDLFTIGRESHALIEGMEALHPARRGFDSNRLDAEVATPELTHELRDRFLSELRDRDGHALDQLPVRMLEKTPKNTLRVPFLAKIFPEARFVYLYRDPRETLSSMIEAWQSGKFRTYPVLPGWNGLPWSLLLVPGWRDLDGRPLQDIVAAQWEATTRILLDDLEALPRDRCVVVRYDAFVADPAKEMSRLSAALGLTWDRKLEGALPLSRYTVSQPAPDKWRRHADLIDEVLPRLQATIERAEKFIAR
ncbi:sulfotransferase [Rhodanobacter sp. L36]|uniref:sulfotransferase n=1 Tax=Rhodanobacter sp. L36 TaxID=1747221 RepID=UPI00131CB89F|nr:sulfotransferase [Rhodanobacter sp. L36]